MLPCLYDVSETEYTTNGIGKLADCISCYVTEKRNGSFELKMEYPTDGIHAEELVEGNIILARPADNKPSQPFRIYKVTSDLSGVTEIAARHISYQLNYITVSPTTVVTGTHDQVNAAFEALKKNATTDCPFSFETDIESDAYFGILEPVSFRSALGGVDGSMLDSFGGEYEWDFYTVRLWKARGADNGVRIVYGKNLVDFKQEKNDEDVITGVHPYWTDSETGDVVELYEKVVTLDESGLPYERIGLLDCTTEFEEEPTQDQLRSFARSYLETTTYTEPAIDIDIDFAQLWQTAGYEDIAEAERVALCDTVHVYISPLGIEVAASVTETEYDVLLERYKSITLSNSPTSSRNSSISLTVATTSQVKSMIAMTDSSIRISVSKTYATKATLENDYSTTVQTQALIDLSADAVTLSFDKKLRDEYSTTTEVESMIKLSEEGIAMTYVKNGEVRSRFAMEDDSVTIDSGTITFNSGTLAINCKNLTLDSKGNATFSGTLTAPDGNIGGFTIGDNAIYNGLSSLNGTEDGIYLGINGISLYNDGTRLYIRSSEASLRSTNGSRSCVLSKASLTFGNADFGLTSNGFLVDKDTFNGCCGTGSGYEQWLQISNSNKALSVNGSYITGSDECLKTDIAGLNSAEHDYEKVLEALDPVTFEYKSGGKTHIGFTYQNAVKALEAGGIDPGDSALVEVIERADTGETFGGIDYNDIIALLVFEVQKLKTQVDELSARQKG